MRLVLAAVLIAAIVAALATPDSFRVAGFTTPGSQSARATAALDRALGYDPQAGMMILARSPAGFSTPSARVAVERIAARAAADPAVGDVQTAFSTGGLPPLVSHSGRATLVLVHFRSTNADAVAGPINRLRSELREPGVQLSFGGYDVAFLDVNRAVRTDLIRAELIALPLLAVLALVIFRGAIAALIPLCSGAVAVLGTFACLRLLANVIAISIFALDLALLLGLGLAVDYGLFLVSRYREEATVRGPGADAVRATLATAGRAVALSGSAIAVASAALLLFPQDFIYSMGIAGVLVALFSAGSALLLTPMLIAIAGNRMVPRAKSRSGGAFYRLPRWVMRRPVDVALVSALMLIAAAAPALRLTPTFTDQAAIPKGYESRTVADAVEREFVAHLMYPVNLAVPHRGPHQVSAGLLVAALARSGNVGLVAPIRYGSGGTALVQVVGRYGPYSAQSQALVAGIRRVGGSLLVGGNTAEFVDLKHSIDARAPLALAIVGVATLVVLFVLSGSLVLAVKALLFDALGLLAALGLLVLIFQEHALGLSALLAYHGPAAIETTSIVVIVASMFGLTTDYSILLLSRIVEQHEAGQDDEHAVAVGIERSGPVISNAALLMVVALLALATSRVFLVKQLTVGQTLAIVVDVAFVRILLVPSMIRILGRLNWWAPGPLRRARSRLVAGIGRVW